MEEEKIRTEEQFKRNEKLMKRSKFLIISFFMLFFIDLVLFIYLQSNELFILNIHRTAGSNATPAGAEIFSFIFYVIIVIAIFMIISFSITYRERRMMSLDEQIDNLHKFEKWFDWADLFSVVPAFLLFIAILNGFFFSFAKVDGQSMEPTFCNNDAVVIKYTGNYQKDDIVIVNALNEFIIKRVVAVGGDTLVVNNSGVYVNGTPIETYFGGPHVYINKVLSEGEYFVMGDNRNNSTDSRYPDIGVISQDNMLGKVVYRISNSVCPVT